MTVKTKVNLIGIVTVLVWASAFPLTKIALKHYSVNALGVLRCVGASLFLTLLCVIVKAKLPKKEDIIKFAISGALGFSIYMMLFNTGVSTLTSATSSILVATTPIMTAIAASFVYREKIRKLGWTAIIIEFVGILVLTLWDGVLSINIGVVWTLAAAMVFCGYNLYQRKLLVLGYEPLEVTAYSVICASVLLCYFWPSSVRELVAAPPKQIFLIMYLGIMPSAMAYFLWGKALSIAEKTSDVTNFMFVTPLLAVIMGFFILGEVPSLGTVFGGILIVVGLLLFSRSQS